jgi:hypothetical protein
MSGRRVRHAPAGSIRVALGLRRSTGRTPGARPRPELKELQDMTEHHDRDTVVVSDSGSGLGTILGVLLIIALLVAVWYFTLGPGTTRSDNNGTAPVNPPSLTAPQASA